MSVNKSHLNPRPGNAYFLRVAAGDRKINVRVRCGVAALLQHAEVELSKPNPADPFAWILTVDLEAARLNRILADKHRQSIDGF